mmetsp:Transcript_35560/g.43991  ORF Transcript_35560/g.43991 Transcript_35560/m.43991 type:complete len:84 (+) Transcript_35560:1030-1281(+)
MPIALAGNKVDVSPRQVNEEEVAAFVQENNLKYFGTSAKTGDKVDEMFVWTADNLPAAEEQNNDQVVFPVSQEDLGETSNSCC